jgi:hypothetical protein
MRIAARGKCLALPPTLPTLQLHPSHLRHQIKLAGPNITARQARPYRNAITPVHMMRHEILVHHIVFVDANVLVAKREQPSRFANRPLLQSRHQNLNNKVPPGS